MMVHKRNSIMNILIISVFTWLSLSQGIAADEGYNKFDFPEHLRETNISDANELTDYLKYNPVDLGIDVSDDYAPMLLRQALVNATMSDDVTLNQYGSTYGHMRLRKAIAKMYSKLINHDLDPEKNILVTSGATGGVFNGFFGHTSPGDEWIVIEPAYTMYLPMIKQVHGVAKITTLKLHKTSGKITGNDWKLDRKEMESLFTNRTKGILLNNPLNPLGKSYTYDELQFIASMAKKYNTLVLSDEAHEWITFKPHIRIASLPGMFERTITVGSASKSFSVSGWRLGWAYAHENIMNNLKTVNKRTIDSPPTTSQEALAVAFEEELKNFGKPDSYFVTHIQDVKQKRNRIVKAFHDSGMVPIVPEGGYCMIAKWSTLNAVPVKRGPGSGLNFVKWLIENVKVYGLPFTGFYNPNNKHLGEEYVRYCYHKREDTLDKVVHNFQELKNYK